MRKKKAIHKKKKQGIRTKKARPGKKMTRRKRRVPRAGQAVDVVVLEPEGFGPSTAGQSGDIEGLSRVAEGNSESVAELVEEGQDREAEVVSAVENAPEPDQAEVTTHKRRED